MHVKEVLTAVIERFKDGSIPEAIALSTFPPANIPAKKWSLLNRTIMFINGSHDARGIKQWNAVNRKVKKGSKAIHILAPWMKKENDEEGNETETLRGFMAVPVFRVEDTEGDPLDYEQIAVSDLPLISKASEWGISVKAIPGDYRVYGYYSPKREEIAIASKDEVVFFHELAHAAHARIKGGLKSGQHWAQEIVAELSAVTLCKLIGKNSIYFGHSYRYIEEYARTAHLTALQGCLAVMADVEKVLNLITGGDNVFTHDQKELIPAL
ncbi:MAG: antirestriction protein [Nitrospiraceae bacterium]|nr:MAG: antirestriction protein [Nitrospiraceae bacterium]